MAFRALAFVAAGVVLGFALGGIAPRLEAEKQTREIEDLKQALARVDRPNPLRELLPALVRGPERPQGPASATAAAARGEVEEGKDRGDESPEGTQAPAQANSGAVIIRGTEASRPSSAAAPGGVSEGARDDGKEPATVAEASEAKPRRDRDFRSLNLSRFDELSAAQAMRFAASRAALIEQAGLNDEETKAVDQTVKKMNDDLSGYGEEILSQAASDTPPTPSQALGLGHDVTGIMYEGQQQIEKIIGSRADKVEPEAMQIWNFVDMERLRPAAEKFLPKDEAAAGKAEGTTGNADTQDDE